MLSSKAKLSSNSMTYNDLIEIVRENPLYIKEVYSASTELIKIALEANKGIIENILYLIHKEFEFNDYKWLLKLDSDFIRYIPEKYQSEELGIYLLELDESKYKFFKNKTKKLDLLAVSKNINNIKYLDNIYEELKDEYIEYNLFNSLYFIDKYSDDELVKILRINPKVFKLIKKPSLRLIKEITKLDVDMLKYIEFDYDLFTSLLEINGLALKYFPIKNLNDILKAINQNVFALDYVDNIRDFLRYEAFKISGLGLKYIINPTEEQCLNAVKRDPRAIEFCPEDKQTTEIQLIAVSNLKDEIINYIQYIKPKSDDVIIEILKYYSAYIFELDEIKDEYYMTAFEYDPYFIMNFDYKQFNSKILNSVLINAGELLRLFDSSMITREMIITAINNYPLAIQYCDYQDEEIAHLAINLDPFTIYYIYDDLLDEYIINKVHSKFPDYFEKVKGILTFEEFFKQYGGK